MIGRIDLKWIRDHVDSLQNAMHYNGISFEGRTAVKVAAVKARLYDLLKAIDTAIEESARQRD